MIPKDLMKSLRISWNTLGFYTFTVHFSPDRYKIGTGYIIVY